MSVCCSVPRCFIIQFNSELSPGSCNTRRRNAPGAGVRCSAAFWRDVVMFCWLNAVRVVQKREGLQFKSLFSLVGLNSVQITKWCLLWLHIFVIDYKYPFDYLHVSSNCHLKKVRENWTGGAELMQQPCPQTQSYLAIVISVWLHISLCTNGKVYQLTYYIRISRRWFSLIQHIQTPSQKQTFHCPGQNLDRWLDQTSAKYIWTNPIHLEPNSCRSQAWIKYLNHISQKVTEMIWMRHEMHLNA